MRRIHSLDYLKTFLALFVVLAHTNWIQNNMNPGLFILGNGLMRMLVPLFCVIAGYFLQMSISRGKARKWLWRVLALYLFWMLAYLPMWYGQVTGLRALVTTFLWGFFHLWFLIGLFFAGLAVMIVRWVAARLAPGRSLTFLIVAAVLCAVAGLAMQYSDLFGYADVAVQRYRNGIFMCFPFVVMGYALSHMIARTGYDRVPTRNQILPVVIAGLGLLVLEAWTVQHFVGTAAMIEIPAATYLVVPAIFLLCLRTDLPPQPIDLGLVSASIYFMHIWAFRLADLCGVTGVLGLMAFGVIVPTLVALVYGAVLGRVRTERRARPA